jgi:LmbE family N-acetylglucosaminyl deacetylase
MPAPLKLGAGDRVLVLAPHPDDESIACGGLLLAARAAGSARRVVVVTDGDNNPWPQRWIEKRWRIDAAARARWGARRRAEAQAALDVLGVDAGERHFLGLADSELTALLVGGTRLDDEIAKHIEQFRPTHIALPALEDRHPDHSAVHVATRLAVARATTPAPSLLCFAVHGAKAGEGAIVVALTEAQQAAKREAILRHATQMRLSGGRFLRFAREVESYTAPTLAGRADLPLRARFDTQGLELRIAKSELRDAVSALQLLVLVDNSDGERLRLRIPFAYGRSPAQNSAGSGSERVDFEWHTIGGELALRLGLARPPRNGFFKLERRRPGLVIYDRYGWQTAEFDAKT